MRDIITAVLVDGVALGALYCLIGWAFAFDSLARGYLHLGLGDLIALVFAAVWFALSLWHDHVSPSALGLGMIAIAATYWCLRESLHRFIYVRAGMGMRGDLLLLAGLACALICLSLLELFFPRALDTTLDARTLACSMVVFGVTVHPRDVITLIAFVLVSIFLCLSNLHPICRAGRLVRENREWSRDLRLPIRAIDRWSSFVGASLAAVGFLLYMHRYPLKPETGLRFTILGFVLATAASRRLAWIAVMALLLGIIERFAGSELVPIGSFWASHVAMVALVAIAILNPETWSLKIAEGAIDASADD